MRRLNQNINGEGNEATNLEGLIKAGDLDGFKKSATPTPEELETAKKAADDKATADKAAEDAKKASQTEGAKTEGAKTSNEGDAAEAVELDGVKYKLNEKGDAVNEKGEVVKTKADLDKIESQQQADEVPLVEEFLLKTGIEIFDEKGKPVKFEDSVDGLIEASKAVGKQHAQKEFDNMLNSIPQFKKYYDYLKLGGDEKEYFAQRSNSWVDVKYDDANDAMALNAVVANMVKKGISKEQAELTAQMYKDTNKLKDFGKSAYNELVASEKAEDAKREATFIANQKAQQENDKKYWETVESTVKKGTLVNITIPDNERDDFFKWKALEVKDGMSQADIDADTMPIEQLLQLEYLRYKKFDFSKLIMNGVKTEKVKSLRSRLATSQTGVGEGEGPDKGKHTKPGDLAITLDSVLTGKSK